MKRPDDGAGDWRRVRDAFEHVLTLPQGERGRWLDDAVGRAGALRGEVERLLVAESVHDDFLESPLVDTTAEAEPQPARPFVGTRFGSFRVRRLIAAGGMGAVYEAEQASPSRRVALKTMRTGLATETARLRFHDEVDLLARLRHPAIAQIFDAGVLVEGEGDQPLETPWFAMELVEGARSIVQHAAAEGLSIAERLRLFRAACAGVHHGHQAGVLHRDLKPANLLVDRSGHPKVIDFGVAKAIERDVALPSERTGLGEMVGTLQTMAPEQIAGRRDEVDVRSDVYALGVVLYELLCGRPPFDVSGLSLAEAGRRLSEDEPPPPSRRVPGLAPDLDWIVARAMAKERERRYGSVVELSEDVARFLRHEPVSAGPPSALYPVRKFVRRHRALVGVAALLVVAVLGGLVGTTLALLRARAAEEQARAAETSARDAEAQALASEATAREAAAQARAAESEARLEREAALAQARRATAATDFLVDVLSSPHPVHQGREVRVLDVLERAGALYETRFAGEPDIRARLAGALGAVYHGLGQDDEAERELRRALDTLRALHPEGHEDTARELRRLGLVLLQTGRFEEAERVLDEAVAMEERLGQGMGLYRALVQRGRLELARTNRAAAEGSLRAGIEGLERTVGPGAQETLLALNSLAGVLHETNRFDEAEELYARALDGLSALVPEDHPDVLRVRFNLAMLDHSRGRVEQAIDSVWEVFEAYQRILGPNHPQTLLVRSNLGGMLQLAGRGDEAAPLYAEGIERARDTLPADHPVVLTMTANLAMLRAAAGELEQAEELLLRVLAARRASRGDGHESSLRTLFDLAQLAWDRGEAELGLERAEEGLALAREHLGESHFFLYRYQLMVGQFLARTERFEEAEPLLLDCRRLYELARPGKADLLRPEAALSELYERWGRPDEAAAQRAAAGGG